MKRITYVFTTLALLTTTLCSGCGDLGSFVYFLLPEQKIPAEVKQLANSDKKTEVKAMILVRPLIVEIRQEFIGSDRQLATLLHKQLRTMTEYNEEKLTLIAPEKVEAFKSARPNWHELNPVEIGRHFQVDYVVLLDVNSLSLYERSSYQQFYRGKADLSVKLIDVRHPDDSPPRRDFNYTYPSEAKYEPVDQDTPAQVFRERFLKNVAKRLGWMFAAHPQRDSHHDE